MTTPKPVWKEARPTGFVPTGTLPSVRELKEGGRGRHNRLTAQRRSEIEAHAPAARRASEAYERKVLAAYHLGECTLLSEGLHRDAAALIVQEITRTEDARARAFWVLHSQLQERPAAREVGARVSTRTYRLTTSGRECMATTGEVREVRDAAALVAFDDCTTALVAWAELRPTWDQCARDARRVLEEVRA